MTTNSTDTLIKINRDMIEQNHQQTFAQVLTTRTPGYNLNINGDLPAGSQFDLTDNDDTLKIAGNILTSANTDTSINLKDGNDVLNIEGGKLIGNPSGSYGSAQIIGGNGDKALNFTNGLEIKDSNLNINLQGTGNHTINILGDFTTYVRTEGKSYLSHSIVLSNYNNVNSKTELYNIINIHGSVITQERTKLLLHDAANQQNNTHSDIHIYGDIRASNNSNISIISDSLDKNLQVDGSILTHNFGKVEIKANAKIGGAIFNIGGDVYTEDNSRFSAFINGSNTSLTTGSMITGKGSQSSIYINATYHSNNVANTATINGNIKSMNGGDNFISIYSSVRSAISSLEVNGDIIAIGAEYYFNTQQLNPSSNSIRGLNQNNIFTFNGNIISDKGFNQISTMSGNDDIYIGGDINAINGNTAEYYDTLINNIYGSPGIAGIVGVNIFDLGGGNDVFTLEGNMNSSNGAGNVLDGGAGDDIFDVTGNITASDDGINFIFLGANNDELTVTGNISALNSGKNIIDAGTGDDIITLDGHLTTYNGGTNTINLGTGDDVFTLKGGINASNGGVNTINLGEGNDIFTLTGDVTTTGGGLTTIYGGTGDDTISLKGYIQAGALNVYGGEGDDTLILSATTQGNFDASYKDWLTDLSASGNLADSGIETIRIDMRGTLQTAKLSWLIDLVDQANADGAHITLEDNKGNVITEPQLYLSFSAAADANPIDALLDEVIPHSTESAGVKSASLETSHQAWEQNHSFDFANSNNPAQYLEEASQAMLVG